jgi:hypothetical protein
MISIQENYKSNKKNIKKTGPALRSMISSAALQTRALTPRFVKLPFGQPEKSAGIQAQLGFELVDRG